MDEIVDRSPYCRRCRRALNRYTPPDGRPGQVRLVHAVEARGGTVDHPADPVQFSQLPDPIIECDFCGHEQASRIYLFPDLETHVDRITGRVVAHSDYQRRQHAARTLRTETAPGITNRWGSRWTACTGCAAFVDAGDMWD